METEFTPFASLFGGTLIGLSAFVLLAAHGRIAGISGIVSRMLPPSIDKAGLPQGGVFLLGLLCAAPLWVVSTGSTPVQEILTNRVLLAFAGFLVGLGSVLGNGCTSGHGVCGISRGSARSMVATISFMATAFITVFVLRHIVGG